MSLTAHDVQETAQQSWLKGFLARFPFITLAGSSPLNAIRAKGANPIVVARHFTTFEEIVSCTAAGKLLKVLRMVGSKGYTRSADDTLSTSGRPSRRLSSARSTPSLGSC